MNNPPGAYLQKNLQMWILLEVKGLLGGIIKKGFFKKIHLLKERVYMREGIIHENMIPRYLVT